MNLNQIIRPFVLLFQISGLSPFGYKSNTLKPYQSRFLYIINVIQLLVLSGMLLHTIAFSTLFPTPEMVITIVHKISFYLNYIASYILVFNILYRRHLHLLVIEKLNSIDEVLTIHNSKWNERKLRIRRKMFIYSCSLLTSFFIKLKAENYYAGIFEDTGQSYPFQYHIFPQFVMMVSFMQATLFILIFGEMFESFDYLMGSIESFTNNVAKNIIIIKNMYSKVHEIVELFNVAFGVSLLVLIAINFVSLISDLYWCICLTYNVRNWNNQKFKIIGK